MSFMNTDTKILNRILENRIQQYKKRNHDILGISLDSQLGLTYAMPINVINHINRIKRRNKLTQIDSGKPFEKN